MKSLHILFFVLFFIVCTSTYASEQNSEPEVILYYSIPLDYLSNRQLIPYYGLKVKNGYSGEKSRSSSHPLLDIQLNENGLQGIFLNDLALLKKEVKYKFEENKTSTQFKIDWGLITVGSILTALYITSRSNEGEPVEFK